MQGIYEPSQEFSSYFLMQPVQIEEVKELTTIATEVLKLINFDNKNVEFKEVYTELTKDKDGLYKEITINLKDKSVSIASCQELKDDYFISKKLIYSNANEIKYEIADFLYHMMVLMAEKGVTWEEIVEELAKR